MTAPLPSRAERYDRLAEIRADERFIDGHSTTTVRDFIEAVYWAQWQQQGRGWRPIAAAMGCRSSPRYYWQNLLREDLPRWEPPTSTTGCVHVLERGARAGSPCGKPPILTGKVTDPETGQWQPLGWCGKHREPGRAVLFREGQRDSSGDPIPHPNRGGLLPCYLNLSRAGTWVQQYESVHPGWVPPALGVCADDWPALAKVHPVTRRPKLTLIVGDAS